MVDLTIGILGYMHEEVLGELIESVLNQETTYKFDVIIGVDLCSDRTLDVAYKFQEAHPDLIKVVAHTTNVGGNGNYFDVLRRSKGRYVIIHDGDDVMLPGKIEKMCVFLDQNPDCAMVAHPLIRANCDLTLLTGEQDIIDLPEIFGLDFLVSNCITLSNSQKMYRMPVKLPAKKNSIDFGMDIAHVGLSNIGFINKPLGIKRDFNGSVTKSKGATFGFLTQATLDAFDSSLPFLEDKNLVLLAKERFVVASLSYFACVDDRHNFDLLIKTFNSQRNCRLWLSQWLIQFRSFPKIQYYCYLILGFSHSLITSFRKGEIKPEFDTELAVYKESRKILDRR